MTDFSLDDLIRDALNRWKEPDPHVIARRLLAKVPMEERDRIVLHGLAERVSLRLRMERSSGSFGEAAAPAPAGQSRWARFGNRVHVDGEWKMLGDCTAEDVDWLADARAVESAKLAAVADQFRELAARMRAAGVATVADLGDDVALGVAA